MRLQTFLARAGAASRRSVEAIIISGRVTVNGQVVRERGHPVDPARDSIGLDGREVSAPQKVYYMVNKPKGVTSTVRDAHASRTVIDLLPPGSPRMYPVGRLDKLSTGIILLTNDGELTHRLTHPRFGVKKIYRARVKGVLTDADVERIAKGVELEDGLTAPCRVRIVSRSKDDTDCEIELHEGRKRQIRRVFAALGHDVIELKRISFGRLGLGDLNEGEFRKLTDDEIKLLKTGTGHSAHQTKR